MILFSEERLSFESKSEINVKASGCGMLDSNINSIDTFACNIWVDVPNRL